MDLKLIDDEYLCKLYEATLHYLRFEELNMEILKAHPEYYIINDPLAPSVADMLEKKEAQMLGALNTLKAFWEDRGAVLEARGFEKV